jgi:hypothetical protein
LESQLVDFDIKVQGYDLSAGENPLDERGFPDLSGTEDDYNLPAT